MKEKSVKEGLLSILVVEDNIEIREFIAEILQNSYKVIEASHGKEGLLKLAENNIDLIISDIMMPEMDGFEFCTKIKTDNIYCHIPVILLSAKNTIPDKIKGTESGADVYIEKPFSIRHLEATISNIFQYRNKLMEKFRTDIFAENDMLAKNSRDKAFLVKLTEVINDNLSKPDFKMDILYREIGMGKDVLHKKLKSLSGQAPVEFMRSIRLKMAAQLLSSGEEIKIVMDKVGISSRSYFNKVFKTEFGKSPSEFLKN